MYHHSCDWEYPQNQEPSAGGNSIKTTSTCESTSATKIETDARVPEIKVFQIGPDGTEYYAAHSEEEMREYYKGLVDEETATEDLRDYFDPVKNIDEEFDFNDDGENKKTTWRKLAEECVELPCQLRTGYG